MSNISSFLSAAESAKFTPATSTRVREASKELVSLEQLVIQMRQAFTEPHERMCEARFGEVLDILDEQKATTSDELDGLGRRIMALNTKLDSEHNILTDVLNDALLKTRGELETKIGSMSTSLSNRISELDQRFHEALQDVSTSLVQHKSDTENKRQLDHETAAVALEQRIAQWRAEIDDTRHGDMQEVASYMMDVGQKLMAIHKN